MVLALLGMALALVGLRAAEIPTPVLVALACLAAYTALSFLSILWAAVPGDAWEGADRTLLYLCVFTLFALWRQRGRERGAAPRRWTLAMIGAGGVRALHLDAPRVASLRRLLAGVAWSTPAATQTRTPRSG